ncbi:MAG: sulfurtransferase TusA family protein [Lachnospiraceae bacterium]|nr:sulfurtransferase TusA family protein [Lachnospiraceae bacterium]
MAEEKTYDKYVDITDVVCPVTFVKAKVSFDEMEVGQVLRVHMNAGDPSRNVPRSFKLEGQKVLALSDNHDGTCEMLVQKVSEEPARYS